MIPFRVDLAPGMSSFKCPAITPLKVKVPHGMQGWGCHMECRRPGSTPSSARQPLDSALRTLDSARQTLNRSVPRLRPTRTPCVDWPSAHYWRELIEVYPQARVILTARPADSWWESFSKTILNYIDTTDDRETLGITLVANQALQGRPHDRDHVIALYEAHVAEVKATVPPERLLVHNLGDGWGPLCAHLGVAVPDVPFPSRNTRGELQERFNLEP